MKRESRMYLYVIAYFSVLLILSTIRNVTEGDVLHKVLNIIIIIGFALFIVLLFVSMFYIDITIKKNSIKMKEYIKNNDYDNGIKDFKGKINSYFIGALIVNSQYNLLYLYMLSGKHNEANELAFMYNFRGYEKDIYYFKLLLAVYYGNIAKAKDFLFSLNRLNNRKYYVQKRLSTEMINAIESNNYDSEMFNESKYPIVYDIYKLYNNIAD